MGRGFVYSKFSASLLSDRALHQLHPVSGREREIRNVLTLMGWCSCPCVLTVSFSSQGLKGSVGLILSSG